MFHTVHHQDLQPGDHIYRWTSPFHTHHGIITRVGQSESSTQIVEFNTPDGSLKLNRATIQTTTLKEFTMNRKYTLKRAKYGASFLEVNLKRPGTTYSQKKDDPAKIIERAELSLANPSSYHLLFNNCESFAVYCCTGIPESKQADIMVETTAGNGIGTVTKFAALAILNSADDVAIDASVVIARNLAISVGTAVGAAVLVEGALLAYRYSKYRNRQMTGLVLITTTAESMFVATTTTVGALLGSAIPVPVLGTIIGGLLGTGAGKLIAFVIKELLKKARPLTSEEIRRSIENIMNKRQRIEFQEEDVDTKIMIVK